MILKVKPNTIKLKSNIHAITIKSTLWFEFDCKWLQTSELRLIWCSSGRFTNSGEFGQNRKNHKNSLTGILRCFLIAGVWGSLKSSCCLRFLVTWTNPNMVSGKCLRMNSFNSFST